MRQEEGGARIERGTQKKLVSDGWIVASLDQKGIETQPMQPMEILKLTGTIEGLSKTVYQAGDRVYYFVFPDGTGRIIGKF